MSRDSWHTIRMMISTMAGAILFGLAEVIFFHPTSSNTGQLGMAGVIMGTLIGFILGVVSVGNKKISKESLRITLRRRREYLIQHYFRMKEHK